MIKYSGSVLFIDNVCLAYLFDDLYSINKQHFDHVISLLVARYDEIWIAKTIEWEFYLKRNNKRRKKILSSNMKRYQSIRICPIKVSKSEMISLIGNTQENMGEADVILQMIKGRMSTNHTISNMTFFSQDKEAIKMASDFELDTLDYNDFKNQLLESGIIIPS